MSWDDVKITPESVQDFFDKINMDALTKNIDAILDKLDSEENEDHNNPNASNLVNSANLYLSKESQSSHFMIKNQDVIKNIKEPLAIKINTNKPDRSMIISNHKMINKFNLNAEKESRNINYNFKYLDTVNSVSKNLRNKKAA